MTFNEFIWFSQEIQPLSYYFMLKYPSIVEDSNQKDNLPWWLIPSEATTTTMVNPNHYFFWFCSLIPALRFNESFNSMRSECKLLPLLNGGISYRKIFQDQILFLYLWILCAFKQVAFSFPNKAKQYAIVKKQGETCFQTPNFPNLNWK